MLLASGKSSVGIPAGRLYGEENCVLLVEMLLPGETVGSTALLHHHRTCIS